jgi:Anti-sigma-K factor rskA
MGMNETDQEMFYDLLAAKAVYGLDEAEQRDLDGIDAANVEPELRSLEMAVAAIGIAGLSRIEPLPAHLYSRIAANAPGFIGLNTIVSASPSSTPYEAAESSTRGSWFGWLGWAAAAAACLALAANIYFTQFRPGFDSAATPPITVPQPPTLAQLRDEFIRSTADITKASWAAGNVKDVKQVTGDIVWSDEKQAGFMRFRGLPVKGAPEYCYQLWIFDTTQDKATPIDGGIFDVTADGEIIVPINAKLPAARPYQFALTIERHGGVVVSDRENIAALAVVETPAA